MRPEFLATLQGRAGAIAESWERLLRLEAVSSALAHPDALVHLIPSSLFQFFAAAAEPAARSSWPRDFPAARRPYCACGRNPYLAYFAAGEQALLEAVVQLQATLPPAERKLEELAEIARAVRAVAQQEIENFCGVCVLKSAAHTLDHVTLSA